MKVVAGLLCGIAIVAQLVFAGAAQAQNQVAMLQDVPPAKHCASLYAYVWRYEVNPVIFHNTGRRLRIDVAAALCEGHDYARGIPILELEARDALLPPLAAR